MLIVQSFIYVPHGVDDFFRIFWSYFPISQDLQAEQPGFSRSLRRVAGFFCNGEIGAPGLTKPSDDLPEREQVRERRRRMGWPRVFWRRKNVKHKSSGKCLLEEGAVSYLYIA